MFHTGAGFVVMLRISQGLRTPERQPQRARPECAEHSMVSGDSAGVEPIEIGNHRVVGVFIGRDRLGVTEANSQHEPAPMLSCDATVGVGDR